jgi:glycosyltransferase involved in cell wall biosynthesis
MLILSICIPTFNRGQIVIDLVNSILTCNDSRYEIVVLDNCSTDGSFEKLKSINNPQLKVFQNDVNIGSSPNVVKSILFAEGLYSIICLDKDKILVNKIPELLDFFEITNCILGRCKLFSNIVSPDLTFSPGIKSLSKIAFADTHPTGHFYKTDYYKKSKTVNLIIHNQDQFGFYFEIINASLSLIGSAVILNSIYFETESDEDKLKIISKSFSGKDNFFDPSACQIRFKRYYTELFSLKLNYFKKLLITLLLIHNNINSSIFAYKYILSKKELCIHYCVESYELSKNEMFSILRQVNRTILSMNKFLFFILLPFIILINLFSIYRILKF